MANSGLFSSIRAIQDFTSSWVVQCHSNDMISPPEPGDSNSLHDKIVVTTSSTELTWATDETYSLNLSVAESGSLVANILANTIYGARHACETLLQLIVVVDEYSNYTSSSLHALSRAKIVDQPAYAHRGLLIDTARNFIPVKLLKKQLDAMATSKMNVFHWHVTDTQSFPLMIDRIPEMVSYGAYSSDAIYTPNEVKDVIQYAKYRGIRVILEFDGPAHAGNGWQWGPSKGLGNLALCINQQPWRNYCIEPPCGQLNIINPNLYTVLQDIFQYMANANLGEQVFHMGGDEIFLGCWNSTEEIVSFMLERGMGRSEMDFLIIWSEYQNKALQLWKNTFYSAMQNQSNGNNLIVQNSPSVVLWSSHLTDPSVIRNFLSNEQYVIQTWLPSSSSVPKELLALGYKLIISTKNAWYLDHGFWGKTTYYNWKTVYDNQLALEENILGGEVCAWTEFIDKHSLESRIWPRAAAAAERLWSNPDTRAVEAESRFFRHRNRLITRGIQPEAIAPKWCEQNESQCH
ncbi:chitooligosaccharidolytic beta-N-acetylglucosaminidase [Anopheles nili]|uniref:chitooligosaccharidolytic beta-N-acetylglucosaminidase n=1 Tax=Anopheles nili TaxID=185578 RepID=UPI00237B4537|nr:chitooligosaccharidolytic beta-N-acetylglucosaminidase [Anopheles nili]